MTWKPAEADDDMKARFRAELEGIYKHLGSEAPEPSTEVTAQVNKDGQIIYITPTEVYALAGYEAVRYRPSRDGTVDANLLARRRSDSAHSQSASGDLELI